MNEFAEILNLFIANVIAYTFFLTLEQKQAHGGHTVLRWMMDNIYIRTDSAGNIKADKEKSISVYLFEFIIPSISRPP